jgi:hypothetical protein
MFIDPHIDPERQGYGGFMTLLEAAGNRSLKPLIEIHRVCYEGSGPRREVRAGREWQQVFGQCLKPSLALLDLRVDVFIWDDFHDRYLITDLIGISVPNGFDVSNDPNARTTWTRLGRNDRDDVQREFHPSSGRHKLHEKFSL